MNNLTHLSLFSGIGGLDLAAEWAGFETVGQCEFAEYPYKVLCKHWPDVPKWRDIYGLSAGEFYKTTGIEPGQLTCISGGFPCQPHSFAGKRKASCDERDLWPEMRRVIGEIKPKWVVGENVRGLLSSEDGRFFRGILRDFANMGYDVGWGIIRACDAGAIHRRERIAIIARRKPITNNHSERCGYGGNNREKRYICTNKNRNSKKNKPEWDGWELRTFEDAEIASNSDCKHGQRIQPKNGRKIKKRDTGKGQRGEDWLMSEFRASLFTCICGKNEKYCKPLICRNDDGFSTGMDRIKCLGNAVVPQQFYPVFKAIYDIETAL